MQAAQSPIGITTDWLSHRQQTECSVARWGIAVFFRLYYIDLTGMVRLLPRMGPMRQQTR
ncbi:MAG: hypothetical protein ETSY2_01140 [Candidatus Entotheonella gemina]|uniref:Uncharacterized protein n=1 Tax=Candidatus Entotheonella gemina TaxID=1429439 RepID=W4MG15_9BACT|nr:MAG: hypothetical protein ETSY2_01140 [Candidatus Entotheonella gemina]